MDLINRKMTNYPQSPVSPLRLLHTDISSHLSLIFHCSALYTLHPLNSLCPRFLSHPKSAVIWDPRYLKQTTSSNGLIYTFIRCMDPTIKYRGVGSHPPCSRGEPRPSIAPSNNHEADFYEWFIHKMCILDTEILKKKNTEENEWINQPHSVGVGLHRCQQSGVRLIFLIHFFFTNFTISSVFGIKDKLLLCNHSGLHSQTPRPGAVEGLGSTLSTL